MATNPNPICAVCNVGANGGGGGLDLTAWTCDRCGASVHDACYWGRTVSVAEWRQHIRRLEDTDETSTIICSTCRAQLITTLYGKATCTTGVA